jgi:hypothetical protein
VGQNSRNDDFSETPQGTFQQRKQQFLEFCINNDAISKGGLTGIYTQIPRLELNQPLDEDCIQEALNVIYRNRDCNDFTMNGLLRLLYKEQENPAFSPQIRQKIEECVLDFKYWWDDGRLDTTYRCYHTENHQALYHTAELLAGQLHKDQVFANGMTGKEHMQHAKERLERWLEFRFRFGFSEWLSSYYDVDIVVLTGLYDFAEDQQLKARAGIILDLLMFDLALHQYHGVVASTSGRMYVNSLITGHHNLSPALKLLFGEGKYLPAEIMGTICLSSTSYRCPELITGIATDYSKAILNKQKSSINVEDAYLYGLSYDKELDIHLFWGMQEFIHPLVIDMSKQLSEKYQTYPYRDYDKYIRLYQEQKEKYGKVTEPLQDRFALSEANIVTYRTPDYMLSSVSDYRPGAKGYQQHVWQATLDRYATVFTTSPGALHLKVSPNYWSGNAALPRAAQSDNVLICIYDIPESEKNDFTHAYFPKHTFDEVIQKGSWVLGRKGDGYIALYSGQPVKWQKDEQGKENDLVAEGRQNFWICEMGSKDRYGSFLQFTNAMTTASMENQGTDIIYHSPSQGKMSFGWKSPFVVGGKEILLRGDYRYDNPYCKALFDSKKIEIRNKNKQLILDFEKAERFEQ